MERIRELIFGVVLRGAEPPMELRLFEIQPGVIFTGDNFAVSAFPVWHRGPDSYGFAFEEKEHRPFLPEKAEALGVPSGPLRRDLVNGLSVTLPDGTTVRPDDVLGPSCPGTRLVHIGDVGRTDELVLPAQNADLLVMESTYLDEEAEMAQRFAHMTARGAAELAAKAGVRNLVLTHLSRRYRERDILAEAQAIFPHVHVARDFDMFQVRRGEMHKVDKLDHD